MLLLDDSKRLEKALDEEAAAVIARILEKTEEKWRQELATKADLLAAKTELRAEIALARTELLAEISRTRAELRAEMAQTKHDILRWMVGGFIAQTALLVAVLAFLK
jgi:hypothetical protein